MEGVCPLMGGSLNRRCVSLNEGVCPKVCVLESKVCVLESKVCVLESKVCVLYWEGGAVGWDWGFGGCR